MRSLHPLLSPQHFYHPNTHSSHSSIINMHSQQNSQIGSHHPAAPSTYVAWPASAGLTRASPSRAPGPRLRSCSPTNLGTQARSFLRRSLKGEEGGGKRLRTCFTDFVGCERRRTEHLLYLPHRASFCENLAHSCADTRLRHLPISSRLAYEQSDALALRFGDELGGKWEEKLERVGLGYATRRAGLEV